MADHIWCNGVYDFKFGTVTISDFEAYFEGMGITKDDSQSKMQIEVGTFDVPDKRGLTEGLDHYSVKLSWPSQNRTFHGNVSPDGKTWTFETGDSMQLIDEQDLKKLEDESEEYAKYNHNYQLHPENQGKIIWVSGGTGMGKTTLSELLRQEHEFVYYEGDAFMFNASPYAGKSIKGPSPWGTKWLKNIPEDKKTITRICIDSYLKLMQGTETPLKNYTDFYDLLCDDILREKAVIGGTWVVPQSVYLRPVRDFIRQKLGPQCVFVLLDMDEELQLKRLALRGLGEGYGEVTEEAIDAKKEELRAINRTKGYQRMEEDEANTVAVKITETTTPKETVDFVLSKI